MYSFQGKQYQAINPWTRLSLFPVFLGRWCYPVFPYIIFPLRTSPCSCSHYVHLDHQIHFYTIPSLDPYPTKPIRHAVTFAVDDQHLKRLQPLLSASGVPLPPEPVDFCVVKRSSIALFTMKDRLIYQKVRFSKVSCPAN